MNGLHLILSTSMYWSISEDVARAFRDIYSNLPDDYLSTVANIRENRHLERRIQRQQQNRTAIGNPAKASGGAFADIVDANGVLHLDLSGVMVPRSSSASDYFGSSEIALDKLDRIIANAKNSEAVKGLAISIDCPGGPSIDSRNVAVNIENFGKPFFGFINGQATSAAYDILSSANVIYASPSHMSGSIGTMTVLRNTAQAEKAAGITTLYFASGEMKLVGCPNNETGDISETDKQYYQDFVNKLGKEFSDAVIRRRQLNAKQAAEIVKADVYMGKDSIKMGLVDKITTKEQFLSDVAAMMNGKKTIPRKDKPKNEATMTIEDIETNSDAKNGAEILLEDSPAITEENKNEKTPLVVTDEMRNLLESKGVKNLADLQSLMDFSTIGESARKNAVSLAQKYSSMASGEKCTDTFDDLNYDRIIQMASTFRDQAKSKGLIPAEKRETLTDDSAETNNTDKKIANDSQIPARTQNELAKIGEQLLLRNFGK